MTLQKIRNRFYARHETGKADLLEHWVEKENVAAECAAELLGICQSQQSEIADLKTDSDDLRTLRATLQTHNWCGYNDHVPGKLGRCIVCGAELTEVEEAEAETAGVTG